MILRNAGEYLEKKINENNLNTLFKRFYFIFFLCFLLGIFFDQILQKIINVNILYLYLIIIISFFLVYQYIKNIDKNINENNEKGLIGEKTVAFELSRLQGKYKNFYVINDFQNTKIGNIDHIIICEKGIFTIETKNRGKIYENKKKTIINQARREAGLLQKELKIEFNINFVNPIIAIANENFIVSEKTYDYIVNKIVNYKNIENMLNKKDDILNPIIIENIFLFLSKKQIS